MIFYQREIGSRLIGLSQRKGVLIWHAARYARGWLRNRYG
jgi:hypothetical protein